MSTLANGRALLGNATAAFAAAGPYGPYATGPAPTVPRALQFASLNPDQHPYAALATPDTALTGADWTIETRLRFDAAPGPAYVSSQAMGDYDKAALIYNYTANTLEFFDTYNATGGTIRLALTMPTPPGPDFHVVRFAYTANTAPAAGGMLRAFLNGAPAGSLALSAGLAPLTALLVMGRRTTDSVSIIPAYITLDYRRHTEGSPATVNLDFNEAAPPYANAGSYSGTVTLSTPPPTSITL